MTPTDLCDAARVGHKFARQHQMRLAGFPVPEFVCLPAESFDRALEAVRPEDEDPEKWCSAAHTALRDAPLPPDLAAEVDAALAGFPDGTVFAVRACVVAAPDGSGEDSADDPFAGMSESYLYVRRDQVFDRVRGCWASAFAERAVRYRAWKGTDPRMARVAVGIQTMVPGTRSFVAFTRDPRDGARKTVIAAAHGIGTGVVAEEADIDHYFVEDGDVRIETVVKRRMVGPDGASDVPPELAEPPVFTPGEAGEIADLCARVEKLFGAPQDIEGTSTSDGTIYLVQSRPIVQARPEPRPRSRPPAEPDPAAGTLVYWSNHNLTESFPGVSGALTYSQAQEFYRRSFGDLYWRLGVPKRRYEARKHRLEQMVGFLDGRIYYRLEAWQQLHGLLPAFEFVRPRWEATMGITGPARGGPSWTTGQATRAVPGLFARFCVHPRRVRQFLRWWDEFYDGAGDLSGLTPDELVSFYRALWGQVSVRWGVTLTNSVYLSLLARMTSGLVDKWAGGDRSLLAGLLTGGRENRSLQAVRAAMEVAAELAADENLRAAVLQGDSEQVWRDIQDGRYGSAPLQTVQRYLRRYGDRSPHDLKLEEPTPRQHPWMVLDLIRPFIHQGLSVQENRDREQRAAEAGREKLASECRYFWRRATLRLLAAALRQTVRFREDTRLCRSQLYGLSREVLWRLGAELAGSGLLDDPLDVVDLTVQEVLGAFDGTVPGTDLRPLAAHRAAERRGNTELEPLDTLVAAASNLPLSRALRTATAVRDGEPGGELRGLGSSPGVVRGRACVVKGLTIDAERARGTILIARETDPGWLFLMMAADGLVVERGTLLSHTAITGRLLGIPTVVAVAGATTRIPDGALIEIDGAAGTIQILETGP